MTVTRYGYIRYYYCEECGGDVKIHHPPHKDDPRIRFLECRVCGHTSLPEPEHMWDSSYSEWAEDR